MKDVLFDLPSLRVYRDSQAHCQAGAGWSDIGALFRNWIPVKLYHKPNPAPPQVYEYWMPLL